MFIMHFFSMIVFTQAELSPLYEAIKNWWNEKIKGGDYWPLDTTKIYYQAYIKPRFQNSDGFYSWNSRLYFEERNHKREEDLLTNIKCEKSLPLKILVDEYEKELAKIWKKKKIDNFFLVYNVEDLNKFIDSSESITFKEVIEEIRKRNNERKETKTKDQFYFKEIYEGDKYKEKHFFDMIRCEPYFKFNYWASPSSTNTQPNYCSKTEILDGILFRIKINETHYCFELSKKEIINIVKECLNEKEVIYQMCFDLYEDTLYIKDSDKILDLFAEYKSYGLKSIPRYTKNCELNNLVKDKQDILQWYKKNNISNYTDQNLDFESMKYLEKIKDLAESLNLKRIEAFDILLKSEEIGILIEKVLLRSGARLDALFGYLLVVEKIISRDDLNNYINNILDYKNSIILKLSDRMNRKFSLIVIYLFVEAERYINEQEVVGKTFQILKEIGNIMENGLIKSGKGPNQTIQYLNLVDIMNKVFAKQSENIEVYGIYNIYNIISLLADSNSRLDRFYLTRYKEKVDKNGIIKNLKLDENKVKEDNKKMMDKLKGSI
ncbi:uncharacterized protein VNE69_01266 [Vairimorpha necatrix]|uniref:Uncharacterized protein n=1 Tax=Vairimorpha necatrix TaxID=6039 RepID=A0AAX4J8Q1_9MICR